MKVDLELIMKIAQKTAEKSPCRFKVSCILVDRKGNIVATGYNHHAVNGNRMGRYTVHAEVDALNKVRKPSNNLIAFIYRLRSKKINPCPTCSTLLKSYGINTVYCTNEENWALQV